MYDLAIQQNIHPDDLVKRLLRLGYQPEWSSAAPGSFSRRGGIVDVYPEGTGDPVRIEFDNQTITSLHTFDPKTKRLQKELAEISFLPTVIRDLNPERRAFLASIHVGDFVVHEHHGIGIFQGLTTHIVDRIERDYFALEYADGDQLFVPIELAEKLDRYVGSEHPALHRLSSAHFEHVTSKIKNDARTFAQELLKRHAERSLLTVDPITKIFPEENELANACPFDLTSDQERALEEVMADFTSTEPTDRLLIGDVGFGKTEVALRASLRAVMSGKQVALLAPTTILAQQHFDTFEERLAPYAISIGLLSRFQTPAEQRETIKKVKAGAVDVLIGTSRILSKDVSVPKLSLLIVDEEQRFGVRHKEALTNLRRDVHTLSLSATPIPRSLHLAMSGVRNMSVITIAPEGRKPITTIVEPLTEKRIREAIASELGRNGQVYFVHNRVVSIERAAEKLRKLVPKARVAVAHGQLPSRELANVIRQFDQGETNVLVTSSIIENGLDLPRVNTLIVEDATQFGLGQLHQLRGRIGRKDIPAVAYFLYNRKKLPEKAKLRLDAIQQYAELGAGFELARIDLELRGAGHILSKKQHGHVAAVGLSLYTRLLNQAVEELKCGIAIEPAPDVTLALPLTARIDTELEPDEQKRIRLYQELSMIENEEELQRMESVILERSPKGEVIESRDRLKNFFYFLHVKLLARRAGFTLIRVEPNSQLTLGKKRRFTLPEQKQVYEIDERAQFVENDVRFPQDFLKRDWQEGLLKLLHTLGQ
ncbi:MAG: CarD family transcriptional regulator [bacterium]|nr:CarD family transcriptional regulator [bacterium]